MDLGFGGGLSGRAGFDAVWHGLVNPDFEAATIGEMVRHLSTVHLPIYFGAICLLLATALALIDARRRSTTGLALPVAFAGAVVATAGEAWHAYSHLQLTTHSGPIAGSTAFVGFVIVVIATWLAGRRERRSANAADERRAA
ncbi:MAG: hypothetical protein ACREJV_08835 [Candidatus Rokuibacteriota bacterium]